MLTAHHFQKALERFLHQADHGWAHLPFFRQGRAHAICRRLDQRLAEGVPVLPAPEQVFAAFAATPLPDARVVILGQDPYPTPGDAHGLAFSYRGGRRLPASLKNIARELQDDGGWALPAGGDLTGWAGQGVLLLNTALTVEAGLAGAHAKLGWDLLADEAIAAVSRERPHAVFILWGAKAVARRRLVDEGRHLVIVSAHPSPLSARTGFFGSRPFSRTNQWLAERGEPPIAWG